MLPMNENIKGKYSFLKYSATGIITLCLLAVLLQNREEKINKAVKLPAPPPVNQDLVTSPISASLFHFAEKAKEQQKTGEDFISLAESRGLLGRPTGHVNVEIVNQEGDIPVESKLVESFGGIIDAVWRGQTSAWLSPDNALELARALPPEYYLRHAHLAMNNNEGPATVGSNTYIAGGADGSGIIIGIIDRNFVELTAAENMGVVPVATRHNYADGAFESGDPVRGVHGTAHLETVFDHAPGATYHLFRIGNSTHLGLAVDEAINQGVQILSATQSFYNEGWADDSGAAAQAAYHAANNGILYVSSAGNRALSHWQGMFNSSDSSGWHEWNGTGDNGNLISWVPPGEAVELHLQWDRYNGGPNYDLYLYDVLNQVLASSESGSNNFEHILWVNNSPIATVAVNMAVYRVSGTPVELEVFNSRSGPTIGNFEHAVAAGSITSPSTNTHANSLDIGAVPFNNYTNGNLTGYSSQGPTNSGNRGVDLVAPTNTTTFAYGGEFGGTSCSTPNTAGAIAALWSGNPELDAEGVRKLFLHKAQLYNDWGVAGPDPVYGYGGLFLAAHQPNTTWLDRLSFNVTGSTGLPYYWVTDAQENAVHGGRTLILGGNYPESLILDKPQVYQSVVEPAILGQ